MKSIFLKKLSELLIPNKETDYIDLNNLIQIEGWPLLKSSTKEIEEGVDVLLSMEYNELINFHGNYLTIDCGGESQGLYRLTISLNENDLLFVKNFTEIPELQNETLEITPRLLEEDYEKLLDSLQMILENQD